jgi:polysaccharide deacetylase family protein (PEP-CTERM system associated)
MKDHAFTIDLEDWHQLFRRRVSGKCGEGVSSLIPDTHHILNLLDEINIRATFFVVGSVADSYPELVREVAQRGHEIGSHTHSHDVVNSVRPSDFVAIMDSSRKQLQDIAGQHILGFRAPEFSVNGLDCWLFEVLAELGFLYDSSVYPTSMVRNGIPEALRYPFVIETPSGPIHEFPLATWNWGQLRLPVAGGSYFRFWPVTLLSRALTDLDASGCTAVFYFHPYEFHRGWLYLSDLSWDNRLRAEHIKYLFLHNFLTKRIPHFMQALFARFQFRPLGDIYESITYR